MSKSNKYQQQSHKDAAKWMEAHYNYFIKIANKKYSYLSKKGIAVEEIVNEALVSVYDMKPFPSNEDIYKECVSLAMDNIFINEKKTLSDVNFTTKKSENNSDWDLTEKLINTEIDSPSKQFVEMYNYLHQKRFGVNNENKVCVSCGGKNISYLPSKSNHSVLKCAICEYKMSETSRTYLDNIKLKPTIIYKMAKILCKEKNITSVELAKKLEITQKTAFYRMALLLSAKEDVKIKNADNVMARLLVIVDKDESPLVLKKRVHSLSYQDVNEMKRLKSIGYSTKELSQMFKKDESTIRKTINGVLNNSKEKSTIIKKRKILYKLENKVHKLLNT